MTKLLQSDWSREVQLYLYKQVLTIHFCQTKEIMKKASNKRENQSSPQQNQARSVHFPYWENCSLLERANCSNFVMHKINNDK